MDKQLYSTNDFSTSCANMVNFGSVTPEIEVGEICAFETILQLILNRLYWIDFHDLFTK